MPDLGQQPEWVSITTWPTAQDLPSGAQLWERLLDGPVRVQHVATDLANANHALLRKCRDSAAALAGTGTPVELERRASNIRFTNLVSGRFTEVLFESVFRPPVEAIGLGLVEEVALQNFLDYRVTGPDDFELSINVKNAGVQFRASQQWVGLPPEDTLPIATYKIFGSALADIPPLVYVYLVDWGLIGRLRQSYWDLLSGSERDLLRLISCVRGSPRKLEDAFIEATVADRVGQLRHTLHYENDENVGGRFRAASGAKCRRIFFQQPDRSPYVFKQRMQTDPNTHLSIEQDTLAFPGFIEAHLRSSGSRTALLADLQAMSSMAVPAPTV